MKILVAVKQVMEPETRFKPREDGLWISLEQPPRRQLNHFDEFAVEEAVRLKEAHTGSRVEAVTVGPAGAAAVLERVRGMGADEGFHIILNDPPEDDDQPRSHQTAGLLAKFAQGRDYDLILTGVMSEDGQSGLVGPMTAARLGRPSCTSVVSVKVSEDGGAVRVEREMEGGLRQELEITLPALLTVQSGLNKPRYPTLSGLLRAKKTPPVAIPAEELGLEDEPLRLIGVRRPERTRQGLTLAGSTREKAQALARILKDKALI